MGAKRSRPQASDQPVQKGQTIPIDLGVIPAGLGGGAGSAMPPAIPRDIQELLNQPS